MGRIHAGKNIASISGSNLLIPMGIYPGITSINQYGRNPSCADGASEEIWEGSSIYTWPTTADMTHISQTTDQAALRGAEVRIHGLDINWDLVEQTVLLDATLTTTPVALDTPLLRVDHANVNGDAVNGSTIRLHNAAENIDYFVMPSGSNFTALGWHTVPAGHTAYITHYWGHHNPTTGQTFTSNLIKLSTVDADNGYARMVVHQVGVSEDGGFIHPFVPYKQILEKTDIILTSSPIGTAADISAGFDLIVVRN